MVLVLLPGCGGMRQTTFVNPDYNFEFVERVAVIPFENLTDDRGAGARMTRFFITELLATRAFDVVEPGEVAQAMSSVGSLRVAELPRARITEIGGRLQAQALFLGSIVESSSVRSGSNSENVVTFDVRLVEAETGSVIWSTTHTETGRGLWAGLFGTSGKTMGEVSRSTARKIIDRLVD
jgi:TolB-like protein